MIAVPERHRKREGESGETLIEILVAIVIMGIGALAVMAGFGFSIAASDLGRKQANGDAFVRTAAEAIQNSVNVNGLATCASAAATYTAVGQSAVNSADGSASGTSTYTLTVATPVTWSSTSQSWSGACSNNTTQRIALDVSSVGTRGHHADEHLTVVLLKPCNGSLPTPC